MYIHELHVPTTYSPHGTQFEGASMIMLVFDVNSKESFKSCTKWYQDVAKPSSNHTLPGGFTKPLTHGKHMSVFEIGVLVGNKSDNKEGNRDAISQKEAEEFADQNNLKYYECSAPITWASMALAGAIGAGALAYYHTEKERLQTQTTGKVTSVGKPLLGGPWTLVDCESGSCVTDASFHGKHTLLYFGFTHCPDICPNELVRLGDVLDKIPNVDIEPLFITVDPARDTVQQMEAYKKDFHPKLRMLTGTPDQVKDVTKAYRVYFTKADESDVDDDGEDDEEYLVDHSIVMYLISPSGEFLDFFTQSARVDDIVKKITALTQ
ncbi:hypothetical protein DYB28_002225 [Aphanomyces astaci]|uniref:Thioredoxin domain-containing protein n=1 Tax=Aphanomyces astaci TaxID=112090 RepID=A0A397A950_APHAT|nr:hypothetical protein DYB36_007363 [Aphanomyces astaci]RLO09738.1 hypothetical protein DYB28_002225 [Aphanomyces astaci]